MQKRSKFGAEISIEDEYLPEKKIPSTHEKAINLSAKDVELQRRKKSESISTNLRDERSTQL